MQRRKAITSLSVTDTHFSGYGSNPTMRQFNRHGDVVIDVKSGNRTHGLYELEWYHSWFVRLLACVCWWRKGQLYFSRQCLNDRIETHATLGTAKFVRVAAAKGFRSYQSPVSYLFRSLQLLTTASHPRSNQGSPRVERGDMNH